MAFQSIACAAHEQSSGIAADFPGTAKCDGVLIGGAKDLGCVCMAANPVGIQYEGRPWAWKVLGDEHMIAQRITDPRQLVNVLSHCGAPSVVKRMVPVG